MKKIEMELVMKWETPSKKKNYSVLAKKLLVGKGEEAFGEHTFEVLTVMTSITQLAMAINRRTMMFKTRMTFRIM
jgi:hypothetical protein